MIAIPKQPHRQTESNQAQSNQAQSNQAQSNQTEYCGWQAGFLAMVPMIERQARTAFGGLPAETREDALAEVIANAMCAYRRLYQRGKLQRAFPSALARFAIAQYRVGRRVGTPQCSGDVYSLRARKQGGIKLSSLGTGGDESGQWRQSLADNRCTPIPDQVAFRVDFPRWLHMQRPRDREMAHRLMLSHTTGEVAREFGVTPSRVSQLRRQLADSWYAFNEPATNHAGMAVS